MLLLFSPAPKPIPGLPSVDRCATAASRFFCPTKWQLWHQVLALLPRGRAWQTHEPPIYTTDAHGDPDLDSLTVQQRYWAAYAEVLAYLHARACALLSEMFCSTVKEMRQEWLVEWGFPDACEAYDALCEKVTDIPDSSCAGLTATALRRGWVISCADCGDEGYVPSVADDAVAGCAAVECPCTGITIRVFLSQSPAYVAEALYPVADVALSDCSELCGPRVEPLICLIERIRPAHVPVTYEVIP